MRRQRRPDRLAAGNDFGNSTQRQIDDESDAAPCRMVQGDVATVKARRQLADVETEADT